MLTHPHNSSPTGVGTTTVRLRDIPNTTRIQAARQLMATAKDQAEYLRLFELAYAPGDAGGRITA